MLIDLVLRPATPEDLPDIATIWIAARRAASPAMPPPVTNDRQIRAWIMEGDFTELEAWVAETHGRLVGVAAFTQTWLDHLYVAPDAQGTGVGSALLEVVKARLADGFGLWVFVSNHPARSFYRRHGLVESGHAVGHTAGPQDADQPPQMRLDWEPRQVGAPVGAAVHAGPCP